MNGSVNTVTEYDLTQWLSPSNKSSSIVRADKQEPRLQQQSRQQRTCLQDSMAAGVDKTIMQQQCECNKQYSIHKGYAGFVAMTIIVGTVCVQVGRKSVLEMSKGTSREKSCLYITGCDGRLPFVHHSFPSCQFSSEREKLLVKQLPN